MADQQAPPAAAPAAAPFNPVPIPPGVTFESRAERHERMASGQPFEPPQPSMDAPPESFDMDTASRLEQARAHDRGVENARQGVTPAAPAEPKAEGDQPQSNLRPRPRGGQSGQREQAWQGIKAKAERADLLQAEVERLKAALPAGLNPDGTRATAAQTQAAADITAHEEYKRLKAERDSFYEEIKHVRVEADPEFRAKFDTKRDAAIKIAKSVAGGAGDDIARILSINDPDIRAAQLAERIKDFGEGSKARIMAANAQLSVVDVEREMEIATRKATWEMTQKQRQAQQQSEFAQRVGALDRDFQEVLTRWDDPQHGMPLFQVVDKNRAVANARQIFSGERDGRALAEAALKASMFDDAVRIAQEAFTELQRYQESAGRYVAGTPGATDHGGGYDGGRQTPPPPINLASLDPQFMSGIEAARRRDLAKQGW